MAEFSVVIRKRDDDSGSETSGNSSGRRRVLFYDSSDDTSSNHSAEKRKLKKPSQKTASKSNVSNEKQQQKPGKAGPQRCPVCNEILEAKIKKVFSQPASTDVYFPFLETADSQGKKGGEPEKVKICYPCYEHLLYQWREYNMLEIPHKKRKYHDRQGVRIKSPLELKRERERREANTDQDRRSEDNGTQKSNRSVDESEAQMLNEDKYRMLYENELRKRMEDLERREQEMRQREDGSFRRQSSTKSATNTPRLTNGSDAGNHDADDASSSGPSSPVKQPDEKSPEQNGFSLSVEALLHDINAKLDRIEASKSNSHGSSIASSSGNTRDEIEDAIRSFTSSIKEEMSAIQADSEIVKRQMVKMRKDMSELRAELAPVIDDVHRREKNRNNKKEAFK